MNFCILGNKQLICYNYGCSFQARLKFLQTGPCVHLGLLQLCHFRAKGAGSVKGEDLDDEESADEGDDGDFTVYECPGLAPVS